MTRARCPTCGGRIPWQNAQRAARCACGQDFDPDDLHVRASSGAVKALWSAVRALEDKASVGRWRRQQPLPPPHLEQTIRQADQQADAIRDVLNERDPGGPQDPLP